MIPHCVASEISGMMDDVHTGTSEAIDFSRGIEVKQTKSGRPLAEWRYYERLVKRGERWSRI